ncbi:MAG: hypothetical protein JSV50_00125 [Desulfobacteraceae bacterium]|nr:MAG: hypothetical protein JSV50_00125 [Desulfobacteraceae bacterium]
MRVLKKLKTIGRIAVLLWAFLLMAVPIQSVSSEKFSKSQVLDVNSVAPDPSAYKGTIKIRGVVSKVFPSDSLFILIDRREYKTCGVVTCATKLVPVRYSGALPEVKEEVVVTGQMVTAEKGFIFKGKEIQRRTK